jgi:hypothetical protein
LVRRLFNLLDHVRIQLLGLQWNSLETLGLDLLQPSLDLFDSGLGLCIVTREEHEWRRHLSLGIGMDCCNEVRELGHILSQ